MKVVKILLSSLALMTMLLSPLHAQITSISMMNSPDRWTDKKALAPKATAAFYQARGVASAWGHDETYQALRRALLGLSRHGLQGAEYHFEELLYFQDNLEAREQFATDAWFSAAAHMLYGKLDPKTYEPDWTAIGRKADLAAMLTQALATNTIEQSLEQLAPKQAGYKSLLSEFETLKLKASETITAVPAGAALKLNMTGARVTALQTRLVELRLIDASQISGTFDEVTDLAVKTFQMDQDLDVDGIAGAATIAALGRGPSEKINQLRVNLERWRWLPDDLGRRHVRANIAGFNLSTWENGARVRTHLMIIGKAYRKTPVFSDEIEYAVFNPWWETPASLARLDKLPAFKRDPGAVERLGFQVLDKSGNVVAPSTINWAEISTANMPYRLRQKPGPLNALGQVKIIFPNVHNVYFHDTPTRDLFAQRQRAFSSGCMRTQDPVDLSKWLLAETPEWTTERVDAALATGRETRANLAQKVPVHVLYFTAVSEEDGRIRYLDDIYSRDNAVLSGLQSSASAR